MALFPSLLTLPQTRHTQSPCSNNTLSLSSLSSPNPSYKTLQPTMLPFTFLPFTLHSSVRDGKPLTDSSRSAQPLSSQPTAISDAPYCTASPRLIVSHAWTVTPQPSATMCEQWNEPYKCGHNDNASVLIKCEARKAADRAGTRVYCYLYQYTVSKSYDCPACITATRRNAFSR